MPYTTTSRKERDGAAVIAMMVDKDEEEQIDLVAQHQNVNS